MILHPNTKINLGLHILSKRPDGFHELETLFVPYPGYKDKLEISPSQAGEGSIRLIGGDWDPRKDLSWRAWELMSAEYGIPPVDIVLEKHSPVGAGLGGGSADAAFTLMALNDLFSLGLSQTQLASLAARLGSDCPFFIYNRPMLAGGRGEILEPYDLDLDGYRIEVAIPKGVSVSTKEAYAGITPRDKWHLRSRSESAERSACELTVPGKSISLREVLTKPIEQWKELLVNDFEPSVFASHPQIAELKARFYQEGALYAAMSGSGSAVFGLFPERSL